MRSHGRTKAAGFTLLEMVMVLASLALILLIMAAIGLGALRSERLAARVSHRLVVQAALTDRFRADVAAAAAAPKSLGDMQAGSDCLILRLPDGRHVIYRWREGRLERSEDTGPEDAFKPLTVGDDRVTVEFSRSADGRVLSLRLVESHGRSAIKHVVVVSAALGGDLR